MSREVKNAKITRTFLGYEDHGIFTAILHLDYDGGGQGFGMYGLDRYIKDAPREGTAAGLSFVMRCCDVAGVRSWEELTGTYIRADADWNKVYRIGHITKDKWFDPAEMFARMRPEFENAE